MNNIKIAVFNYVNKFKKSIDKNTYTDLDKLVVDVIEIAYKKGFTDGWNDQAKEVIKIKEELQKVLKDGVKSSKNSINPSKVYKKGRYAGD